MIIADIFICLWELVIKLNIEMENNYLHSKVYFASAPRLTWTERENSVYIFRWKAAYNYG